jgi:hypothetical protein
MRDLPLVILVIFLLLFVTYKEKIDKYLDLITKESPCEQSINKDNIAEK